MTVNDVIRAAVDKLDTLYPDRFTSVDQIKAGSDGNHLIRCIEQRHEKRLDRRRARSYSFEILYFRKDRDAMEFNGWAETMYREFETLPIGGRVTHLTGAHAQDGDDGVFHFVFDVAFTALLTPDPADSMETLQTTEGIKS